MTTLLLFHHAQGLTPGVRGFADELREAGHTVHAPDLFDGQIFATLDDGLAYVKGLGFDEVIARGTRAASDLPADIVYAGFSLGVMPAQALAQTRAGARGGLFYSAAIPTGEFGGAWPESVPVQIHFMESDPFAEEDRAAAEALVNEARDGELFVYPGSGHLFADPSVDDYDETAASLLKRRTLAFLDRIG